MIEAVMFRRSPEMSNGGLGLLAPLTTTTTSVLLGQSSQDQGGPKSNQSNTSSDQGIGSTELIDQKPITTASLLWPNGTRLTTVTNGDINEGASPSSSSGDGDHPMLGVSSGGMGEDEDLSMATENTSAGSTENGISASDMGTSADAEGVWSPDIEQAFQEALQIYPPCGRRKIILSDEGKMYGRNELIARYIKLRTGKTRTRKQVSSHIQVLARKKHREISTKIKDHSTKDHLHKSLQQMSSAQIVNMGAVGHKLAAAASLYGPASPLQGGLWPPNTGFIPTSLGDMPDMKGAFPLSAAAMPYARPPGLPTGPPVSSYPQLAGFNPAAVQAALANNQAAALVASAAGGGHTGVGGHQPAYEGRSICSPSLRLCEFSSYVEPDSGAKTRHELVSINSNDVTHADPLLETIMISEIADKFPAGREGLKDLFEKGPKNAFFLVKSWADISFNVPPDETNAFYAVDSRYESSQSMTISVSTKVCSFGKQVVEKVETEFAIYDQGRFVYRINRSPMCEYMVKFIHQLKKLPETYMMNSVLENFTILQVVTNKETRETLLCVAFVFEISQDQDGSPQYHIYRLIPGNK